jgi:hypothetical protein
MQRKLSLFLKQTACQPVKVAGGTVVESAAD